MKDATEVTVHRRRKLCDSLSRVKIAFVAFVMYCLIRVYPSRTHNSGDLSGDLRYERQECDIKIE